MKAYAAVLYIRATSDEKFLVNIIASKTKVVPLNRKTVTIPKLELMACLVLSQLLKSVRDSLNGVLKIHEIKCWTDSMDCYYWITNTAKVWERFVQSRVMKIRENLPAAKWFHCAGKQNPADIPTRGLDLGKADLKKKWLFGPEFLSKSQDCWPKATSETTVKDLDDSDNSAQPKEHCLLASVTQSDLKNIINIAKYSSTYKLFRVTGYVRRFITNLKLVFQKLAVVPESELTIKELQNARDLWIINEQKEIIFDKKRLKQLKYSFDIFEDEKGILRLKGRLEQ
jgi:hypothetical protein